MWINLQLAGISFHQREIYSVLNIIYVKYFNTKYLCSILFPRLHTDWWNNIHDLLMTVIMLLIFDRIFLES